MIRAKPFYLVAAAVAAACATTPRVDVASEESAIRALNREFVRAALAKDADAVARTYATDASFMPPNAPPIKGQAAIRAEWAQMVALPNLQLTITPTDIDVGSGGDIATEVGTYTFSYTGEQGPVNDNGKYVLALRKIGTEWKIQNDIFSSDRPMPPPPVAVVVIEPAGEQMTMNTAAGMAFQPFETPGFKSGMQLAVIHGDPMGKGDYTIRLRFPAGYTFPAHYHPNAEHLTVLSGTFQLAMGEKEGGPLREYQPGDFLYIPAKVAHYGGARTETVIQLHGIGPFEIKLSQMASSER